MKQMHRGLDYGSEAKRDAPGHAGDVGRCIWPLPYGGVTQEGGQRGKDQLERPESLWFHHVV